MALLVSLINYRKQTACKMCMRNNLNLLEQNSLLLKGQVDVRALYLYLYLYLHKYLHVSMYMTLTAWFSS
jgi:hypothetical protein